MKTITKRIDSLPQRFGSYAEAAEFWDTHDVTDYLDKLEEVAVDVDIKGRRFEIEVDEDVAGMLLLRARKSRVPVRRLASRLLRRNLIIAHS